MAEIVHLVEATPYLPGTGTVTVRMSSARSHGRDIGKNGQVWTPALIAAPVQKISFLGDDQLPGIPEISYGALGVRFSPELGNDAWSAYVWEGALTSVWRGVSGAAFGSFAKIFTGRSGALERPGPNAGSIALRGFEGDLDKDLLTATYAGTGAAEGDLAMKGVPKPWLSGRCEGVQGVLVSKVYWVWQLHGYGVIDEVTAAYEGGLSLGAKHGDYANYAALIAASIPDGGWATCLAQGLVRIANEPSKPIVFDARGAKDGSTYVSKVGAIATHLIKQAGFDAGSINATSASNLDSAFAHDHGLFTAAQTTIGGAVRKMLADIGGYTFPDENGVWRFGRYKAIKTAAALKSDRTALPIVRSVAQKAALSPVGRVEVGARRCWSVHREDDISPALIDALDAAAAAAAAAQATNGTNLYRVETDGIESTAAGTGSAQLLTFGAALGTGFRIIDFDDVGIAVGDSFSVSADVMQNVNGQTLVVRAVIADGGNATITSFDSEGVATGTSMNYVTAKREGIVRQSGWQRVYLQVRTSGGAGTLRIRRGMVNRGPVAAPYVAPTRGATHGSTWDQVTGAGKPEDGATRNAYQGVHNSANTYAKGDIVILGDGTKSYIAKQAVPVSTLITNTAYWGLLVEGSGGAAGVPGYSAGLTNGNHSVVTEADGSGGDYSDAGGQMWIYEGATNRTASASFAKVGSGTWYSIDSAGVYTISDPGTDQATCQFDATYGGVTLRLTYSISKSKAGANAKSVRVTQTREVITYDGTGALAPSTQTTTFNAVLQNSSATVNWSAADLAGNAITPVTNLLSAATGASVTMTAANFDTRRGATNGVVVTASISDGGTHSDVVSVIKVQDGAVGAGAYSLVQSASDRLDLSVPGVVRKIAGGTGWNCSWRTAAPYQSGLRVEWTVPALATLMVSLSTAATIGESNPTPRGIITCT